MRQFTRLNPHWRGPLYFLVSLLMLGCSSEPTSDNADGAGQVTDPWRSFCIATFSRDVAVTDAFGDTAFTARVGQEYLLTDYSTFGEEARVEIAYLTPLGPDTYRIAVTGGVDTFPFTSNCTFDAAVSYYAAFTDATVYATEALNDTICSIPAGTAVPRDMSTNAGASAVTFSLNGPQIYDIMLNAFSAQCGGAEHGFVSVPETQVLGVNTWLIPITVVMKPQ